MNYKLKKFEKGERETKFRVAFRSLQPLLHDEKGPLFRALIAIIVNSGVNLLAPFIIARTIDTYIAHKDFHGVLMLAGMLSFVYVFGLIAGYLQVKIMGGVGRRVLFKLRNAIFTKLQELPVAFFNQNQAGDLISRINNDTDKLNQFFSQALVQFVGNAFLMLGAGIFILSLNSKLGFASLAPAIVVIIITQFISAWIKSTSVKSLQSLGGGGAPLQPDLVAKIDATVATARPNTGYGMTETCGIITSVAGDFFVDKPASCGRAMPTFETRIVGDDGQPVGPGHPGELWVKGAAVIKGYINRPEATAESITDGWLHTGDVAYIDEDQFIFLVDRKKDMVLRGGENIYCAEVEAVLHQHAGVAECSVFGVHDDRLGEEVGAAVVMRPGQAVSAEALREHCAALMAKHKIPRYIWILDMPLPRNASGKFLKRELREGLKTEAAH